MAVWRRPIVRPEKRGLGLAGLAGALEKKARHLVPKPKAGGQPMYPWTHGANIEHQKGLSCHVLQEAHSSHMPTVGPSKIQTN